jgi:DNA repair protein RadC
MRAVQYSANHFNVAPRRCSLLPSEARYTSGLLVAVGDQFAQVSDEDVVAAALRIVSHQMVGLEPLSNPRVTREYLMLRFAGLEHEVFTCVYLDVRHRVLACEDLFRGTWDGASVYPREVVKRALARNAGAVIFAHNHPSGVCEPSAADEHVTPRLKEALALVDIRVLDHLVVAGSQATSMSERGLL